MKSRIFAECDDADPANGINSFNDDLSVFVAAGGRDTSNARSGADGHSSYYNTPGGSGMHHSPNSPNYHFQSRVSAIGGIGTDSWHHGKIGIGHHQNDRLYPSAPAYLMKDHNTLFGVCPSDIDKYSRVVFPVCFLCFNLMYWIIYMHISEFLIDDTNSPSNSDDG